MARRKKSTNELGEFDGRDVLGTTIAVTGAGDGLSAALKIDPAVLHIGETVFVVLETEVGKVTHMPIKDTDALTRVHVLKTTTAAIVDGSQVEEMLAAQREKIRIAHEKAEGIQRLDFGDEAQQNLRGAHVLGEHDLEPADDCELCAETAEAAADGEHHDFDGDEESAEDVGDAEPADA